MKNYEDWAQLIAKNLAHEADYIAAIDKDELDDKAATEAFVRAVLEPFLPENYGIGSGRIVDAFGNCSEYLDTIVYNRDFPRIGMRGSYNTYLYESVLATFAIRAKFIRKTFFESLNACASLAHLETNLDKVVLVKLAKKNGLRPGPNKTFIHDDPLRTGRFELIGRPPGFVFGFSGIKYSYRQLQENIELWIKNRGNDGIVTPMKALPAVIATQGCFAWRNAAPLALSNREMLGIGNDDAPIRLIALQLMYLLNRRLNATADGYGLRPNLNAYLSQFSAPKFATGVGDVAAAFKQPQSPAPSASAARAARDTARFEPARDHAAIEEAAKAAAASAAKPQKPQARKPAPKLGAKKPDAATPPSKPAAVSATAKKPAALDKPSAFASAPNPPAKKPAAIDKSDAAAVFDKPSPFASAPIPPAETPAEADKSEAAVFDKPSPFASAPIPAAEKIPATEPLRSPVPVAPLGSAPIPSMDSPKPAASEAAAAKAIPPIPPVDISLGSGEAAADGKQEPEEDEFIQTVIIPPDPSTDKKEDKSRSSTDAFIARVKEQLSTPDSRPGNEPDFTSTVPQ